MKAKGFFTDPTLTNTTCPAVQKMIIEFITKLKTVNPVSLNALREYSKTLPHKDFYMVAKKHNEATKKDEYETFIYPQPGFPSENFTRKNKQGTITRVSTAQRVTTDLETPIDIDRYVKDAISLVGQFSDNRETLPKLIELFGTTDFINKDAGKKSIMGFRKNDPSTWKYSPYSHSYAVIPNEKNRLVILDIDYPEKFKSTAIRAHLTPTLTVYRETMEKVADCSCKFKLVYKLPEGYDVEKVKSFNSEAHGFEVLWKRDATVFGLHGDMTFYKNNGAKIETIPEDVLLALEKYTVTMKKIEKIDVPEDLQEKLEQYGFVISKWSERGAVIETDIIYDKTGDPIDAMVFSLDPLRIHVFSVRYTTEVKKWMRGKIKEYNQSKEHITEEENE